MIKQTLDQFLKERAEAEVEAESGGNSHRQSLSTMPQRPLGQHEKWDR